MSKWYIIKNLKEFIDQARLLVFKFFGEVDSTDNDYTAIVNLTDLEQEELDQVLSYEESEVIVLAHVKTNKNFEYKITDEILYTILESLNSRLVSNIINKLVNKGLLETAYDTEKNDFVFWVKNDEKKEKPETD